MNVETAEFVPVDPRQRHRNEAYDASMTRASAQYRRCHLGVA